jgi:hypothetical protein
MNGYSLPVQVPSVKKIVFQIADLVPSTLEEPALNFVQIWPIVHNDMATCQRCDTHPLHHRLPRFFHGIALRVTIETEGVATHISINRPSCTIRTSNAPVRASFPFFLRISTEQKKNGSITRHANSNAPKPVAS